jgi:type VI secretion system protein ImpA
MENKLKKLIKPVALDNACGIDLDESGDLFTITQLTKGKEENQFTEGKPADWVQVIDSCVEMYAKSKDIWITIYLCTGLYAAYSFSGLNEGVEFLLELLKEYWNSLYPLIEKDDEEPYEFRLAPLKSLFSLKGLLVGLIKKSTITTSKNFHNISIMDILLIAPALEEDTVQDLYNAINDTDKEYIRSITKNIESIINFTIAIDSFISHKIGEINNTLEIRKFLDLLETINKYIKDASREEKITDLEGDLQVDSKKGIDKATKLDLLKISNRNDVKKILKALSTWFECNEPCSPSLMFVKRAETFLEKNFVEAVGELITQGQNEMQMIFGNCTRGKAMTDEQEENEA